MSIERRLQRLEQQPDMSDAAIRDRCEELGRAHDLCPLEIYEETMRLLAMTPAQREQAIAEVRDVVFDPAECAQHGGRPCEEILA